MKNCSPLIYTKFKMRKGFQVLHEVTEASSGSKNESRCLSDWKYINTYTRVHLCESK